MPTSKPVYWHPSKARKLAKQKFSHRPVVLWFTGLSGSGKSTIANEVELRLVAKNCPSYLLDGDNLRYGLNHDLSFSAPDRKENIRRTGEVAALLLDACLVTLCACISPYRREREMVRNLVSPGSFIEIYVKASLKTCEARDPKGLYRKARAGEIDNFTGIDAPYEVPEGPELTLNSDDFEAEALADQVISYLVENRYLPSEQ